jgi:hypothetical protein
VGGALEVTRYGRLEALVLVGDHELDARKAPPLQRAKQFLVGRLALGVGDLHRQYLPKAVVSYPRDDQYPLAHHPVSQPHLLVAGVHEHVGVGPRFEPASPPRFELGVQASGQGGNEALGEGSSAQSLRYLLDLPGRDALHLPISMSARHSAFSFLW